jgi:hypothetical protein
MPTLITVKQAVWRRLPDPRGVSGLRVRLLLVERSRKVGRRNDPARYPGARQIRRRGRKHAVDFEGKGAQVGSDHEHPGGQFT